MLSCMFERIGISEHALKFPIFTAMNFNILFKNCAVANITFLDVRNMNSIPQTDFLNGASGFFLLWAQTTCHLSNNDANLIVEYSKKKN